MSAPPEPRSKIDLLKSLNTRAKPASEHFAELRLSAPVPQRRVRKGPPLTEMLPGSERVSFNGMSCVRIETRAGLTGARTSQGYACPAYGGLEASGLRDRLSAATHLLSRGEDPTNPERIAFLDTETTSLAGGSGAVAFLVGLGRFDFSGATPEFVVTQYFMEDYDQEEAMIEVVASELASADALASYNGRCFDVPILESRWRMHRRKPAFPFQHFDLLHPARRLWKRRLPDCRLGTIERQLLGLIRYSDVESALVPRIFNDYARGVQPGQILGVLDHHAQDIFSLGALLARFARGLDDPESAEFAHAEDQWGLSGIFQSAGREEDAIACLERAAATARDNDFAFRLAMHLARRLMRMRRVQDALDIFEARAQQARPDRIEPLIELAKYHEHKRKDYAEARAWTQRALEIIGQEASRVAEKNRANAMKRMERLERNIQRSSGSSADV